MIPIKLKLRNFMCYRDNVPALYFDGIHTACVSGDNGSGKSALLDAVTWALWGRARAKSDDDLIHLGQTEMEVEFDFAVSGQAYRILRKRSKPKRHGSSGQTILEFQMASGDGFRSISGDSITQTQQKIINVLHMDYVTFINSAYLMQGRADEFTLKPPVQRKQVLADILGLAFYDELEAQAKELAKQQEIAKTQLESAIQEIDNELAQKPAYEVEFAKVQSELSRLEKVISEHEARLKRLREEKESLENKRRQLTELEEYIRNTERDLARWNDQIKQHDFRLKEYEALIAQRNAIEEGYARFIEARKLNEELDQKFRQSVNLERQRAQLESKVREAGQSLLTEHAVIQNKIVELEVKAQELPRLKSSLQQIQTELHRLAEEEERLRQKRQSSQETRTGVNYLESKQKQLEQETEEIGEKLSLLLTQTGAKCPLCETELGLEGIKLIEAKYKTDKQDKSNVLASSQAELAQAKMELASLEKEISQLETQLNKEKTSAQSKASILSQKIAEAEEAGIKLIEERKRLAEIEERLAKRDFALYEQGVLREIERELAKLSYDASQHEQARQRRISLEAYEASKRKLEEADRLINQEKDFISQAKEATEELHHSLEVSNQKRQTLTTELGLLPQLLNNLTVAESEHQTLIARQKQAQELMWQVKAKLQHFAELEINQKEKEKLAAQASREEQIYKDLAQAFGKKGIQALLIEIALPEIEAEANKLLARMTDNRMHVKIETQRETKKGDVVETLDINISDELGTRNYEMFSGGEAFRINFAIRIALSKLLAKRAGAPLPTLVIDEGFGTQDNSGIEKLKEAINSIQGDFDKILVITHVEELRDAFPVRIDVIKTAEGSTISMG